MSIFLGMYMYFKITKWLNIYCTFTLKNVYIYIKSHDIGEHTKIFVKTMICDIHKVVSCFGVTLSPLKEGLLPIKLE